jgi:hypothetical protein
MNELFYYYYVSDNSKVVPFKLQGQVHRSSVAEIPLTPMKCDSCANNVAQNIHFNTIPRLFIIRDFASWPQVPFNRCKFEAKYLSTSKISAWVFLKHNFLPTNFGYFFRFSSKFVGFY